MKNIRLSCVILISFNFLSFSICSPITLPSDSVSKAENLNSDSSIVSIADNIDNEASASNYASEEIRIVNSNFNGELQQVPTTATPKKAVGNLSLIKPVIYREDARLETEGIPSKVISVYDNTQSKASEFLNPKPIVDTIQEYEKYGNSGDKFYPVGRAIVNGFEGFSNFLNKVLDTPVEVAKTVSRTITDTLNVVGGKVVGLV